jgi:hypothetical protein
VFAQERLELRAVLLAAREQLVAARLVLLELLERGLDAGHTHARGDFLHALLLRREDAVRPLGQLGGREAGDQRELELLGGEVLAQAPLAAFLVVERLQEFLECDECGRRLVDRLARAFGQRRRLRVDLGEERLLEELRQPVDLEERHRDVRLRHAHQVVGRLREERRDLLDAADRVFEPRGGRSELALEQRRTPRRPGGCRSSGHTARTARPRVRTGRPWRRWSGS